MYAAAPASGRLRQQRVAAATSISFDEPPDENRAIAGKLLDEE